MTKERGFTLIELVIVLALIGISSVIGLRFISDMAHSQVASAERAQALAGARFALERLRRELSQAYSSSVQISAAQDCVSFVPVLGAGAYTGVVTSGAAHFILPQGVAHSSLLSAYMAISAPSESAWQYYPGELPNNVMKIDKAPLELSLAKVAFSELFNGSSEFSADNARGRYTLLSAHTVRYCVHGQQLRRSVNAQFSSATEILMLDKLSHQQVFNYQQDSRLLRVDLRLTTADGELVLVSQLQVNYEP
ncbi:PulJ/GspJ family protein [Oceanisphaera avium]|uniref:MSHA biogenesis protein MshO n=1 Tax=Oceanisphaera avium TaxID=1903694 RepID=A0A1Y0CVI5_9GAMM|nr:type II secretion system protein [Oceanisphaera avium]ART79249.1 hypothetical protein CBP12_03050 [Oceanisphaera avium]